MNNINISNRNTIKAVLNKFSIGVDLLGYIKPKMLYLLGGLYSSCHYKENDTGKVLQTNITIPQLAELTGETEDYIKDYFYPIIKKKEDVVVSCQSYFDKGKVVKRNLFTLINPISPYRIYWSGIFSDFELSPEEKGYVMALYMLCVKGTRRYELANKEVARRLNISLNTWKKYKGILEEKGILRKAGNLEVELYDPVNEDTYILFYPYLGTHTEVALIPAYLGDEIPLKNDD